MSKEKNINVEDQELDLIITFEDEDGVEHDFIAIESFEYKNEEYLILIADEENNTSDLEEGEYLIVRQKTDKDGVQIAEALEDEDELQEIDNYFRELYAEELAEAQEEE